MTRRAVSATPVAATVRPRARRRPRGATGADGFVGIGVGVGAAAAARAAPQRHAGHPRPARRARRRVVPAAARSAEGDGADRRRPADEGARRDDARFRRRPRPRGRADGPAGSQPRADRGAAGRRGHAEAAPDAAPEADRGAPREPARRRAGCGRARAAAAAPNGPSNPDAIVRHAPRGALHLEPRPGAALRRRAVRRDRRRLGQPRGRPRARAAEGRPRRADGAARLPAARARDPGHARSGKDSPSIDEELDRFDRWPTRNSRRPPTGRPAPSSSCSSPPTRP